MQAAVPIDPVAGGGASLKMTLELGGMDRLEVVPAADEAEVTLRSAWPHPSFVGRFLPEG